VLLGVVKRLCVLPINLEVSLRNNPAVPHTTAEEFDFEKRYPTLDKVSTLKLKSHWR